MKRFYGEEKDPKEFWTRTEKGMDWALFEKVCVDKCIGEFGEL